ncbi:MAG: SDR family NAD(P)-dependent oxidoreductase [Elusimicrobia bacterium]|nr:SDR family NAD(P)-dependent oxidoreductase [Elusimicrobiota bacterium]
MKALAKRTAWVTGAGRGIGRADALAYAREGARLVLVSRTAEELDSAAREAKALGAEVVAEPLDIRNLPGVRALLAKAIKKFGGVDVLVNNAGILGPKGPLVDVDDADWAETLAVNLSATFRLTREVLAASMLPRKTGCVINVSSSVGRRGRAGWGPYAVSKFGVEGMTQVWAEECAGAGIRFYTVNPTATRTRMRAEAYPREDPASVKTPEAAARGFVELAAKGCKAPTGSAVELDRGTGRLKW